MALVRSPTILPLAVMCAIATLARVGYAGRISSVIAPEPSEADEDFAPEPQPGAEGPFAFSEAQWGNQITLNLFDGPTDLFKCQSSLTTVNNCMGEALYSLLHFRMKIFGEACCDAIRSAEEACWPISPSYGPMLEQYCARNEALEERPRPLRRPPMRSVE